MLKAAFFYDNYFNIIDSGLNLDFVTKENGCSRLEWKVYKS